MAKRLIQGPAMPVWLVDENGLPGTEVNIASGASVIIRDQWTLSMQSDIVADDSDKSFIVPAAREWQILWIWVELVTTATVGNRQLCVSLYNDLGQRVGEWRAGAAQAASATGYYCFAPANVDLDAFRDTTYLSVAFPPTVILPAGYQVRIWDNAAVAAAADDMNVYMMVAQQAV